MPRRPGAAANGSDRERASHVTRTGCRLLLTRENDSGRGTRREAASGARRHMGTSLVPLRLPATRLRTRKPPRLAGLSMYGGGGIRTRDLRVMRSPGGSRYREFRLAVDAQVMPGSVGCADIGTTVVPSASALDAWRRSEPLTASSCTAQDAKTGRAPLGEVRTGGHASSPSTSTCIERRPTGVTASDRRRGRHASCVRRGPPLRRRRRRRTRAAIDVSRGGMQGGTASFALLAAENARYRTARFV
jgi:hypothetical protein